jgi:xanthine dehydrogenase YagS FAD-binding subunit
LKAGGSQCFSVSGENQFHAIFGGGPSYIVHPSDTAPALVALDATFRIVGPSGEREVPAADFFVLPRQNAAAENVLANDELLASVHVPTAGAGMRSVYEKVLDREAWTHAVVSAAVVLRMDGQTCRDARVVLGGVAPIPWRLPEVERLLTGQPVTEEVAARAGELAVAGARPLAKNGYKVPLTNALVRRTVLELARRA